MSNAPRDFDRLTEHEAVGRKCEECGHAAVYRCTERHPSALRPTVIFRCTNHTARWAKERGLSFPKLCTVPVSE